ncbi:MAG TPA: SET domain-containing protein-lysine N-methyltransferase [Spirochaetota bacterium]|nr:SET domain-containing protein-lysine N-methyltransferase [Spirochaetota bacterium]
MKNRYSLPIAVFVFVVFSMASCSRDYENTLEIRTSNIPNAGKGVFATIPIPDGAVLGHYSGHYITRAQHQDLCRRNKWHYVMRLLDCAARHTGGYTRIDGRDGNVFTRINHAPAEFRNVKFKKICEDPYVLIIAIKDIHAGEELYVDYGPKYTYDFMKDPKVQDFFKKLWDRANVNDGRGVAHR